MVPLLGNHDEMMLAVCEGREDLAADWLRLWRRGDVGLLRRRGAGGRGPRVSRAPRFHPPLPLVLRDGPALFRSRQLRGRTALGPTAAGGVAVEVAEVWSAGAPLLGQDGHRRPHRAEEAARSSTSATSSASTPGATATAGLPPWSRKRAASGRWTKREEGRRRAEGGRGKETSNIALSPQARRPGARQGSRREIPGAAEETSSLDFGRARSRSFSTVQSPPIARLCGERRGPRRPEGRFADCQ